MRRAVRASKPSAEERVALAWEEAARILRQLANARGHYGSQTVSLFEEECARKAAAARSAP